jgi:hypothetical protein
MRDPDPFAFILDFARLTLSLKSRVGPSVELAEGFEPPTG